MQGPSGNGYLFWVQDFAAGLSTYEGKCNDGLEAGHGHDFATLGRQISAREMHGNCSDCDLVLLELFACMSKIFSSEETWGKEVLRLG